MQNLDDTLKEYSDVLNTDFSDWEDDFFRENEQFSDVENSFKSRNLIEHLQSANNVISIQNSVSPFRRNNILATNWKEVKLSKLGSLNTPRDHSVDTGHKQIVILNEEKTAPNTRKKRYESSDSEDFYSPNKKSKKSKIHSLNIFSNPNKDYIQTRLSINSVNTFQENDRSPVKEIPLQGISKPQSSLMVISRQKTSISQTEKLSNHESCKTETITSNQDLQNNLKMTTSSQENSASQKMSTSSQENSASQKMSTSSQEASASQKMITSSQEICSSQKMITSSQEISTSQKMITSSQEISTSQKMITSSQESSGCQNITSSQKACISPKMVTSSQESLGNHVMNISIEEDANSFNVASHSSSGTQVVITPSINSNCWQVLTHEEVENLKADIRNLQRPGNDTFSRKKVKKDSPDEHNSAEIAVSDSFYNKTFRRYQKAEKRMIWNVRKKELEVTKREEAVKNREKLLDAREADILKREAILKATQRRYFMRKANMKRIIQKQTSNSKECRKRASVLEDGTNAFNRELPFKVFK